MGSIDLLRETPLNDHQKNLVDTIESAGGILLNLIEDVLTLVRIDHESKSAKGEVNQQQRPSTQQFTLAHCTKIMENIMNSYSTQFDVKIDVHINAEAKGTIVRGNLPRIHQVISNLLTNAVKASKRGGSVELYCTLKDIEESMNCVPLQNVEFKIVDTGIGIPKSKHATIFEPFTQLHNLNESIYPSSGLGLNTVRHIVNSMKGSLTLQSEVGKGSIFTVSLPLELVSPSCKDELSTQNPELDPSLKRQIQLQENYLKLYMNTDTKTESVTENSNEGKAKILIAEDNSINRKIVVAMIKNLGYKADAVSDGVELIEKMNGNYKLIITDLVSNCKLFLQIINCTV